MANTVIQFKQSLINAAPISLNVGEPAYSYVSNTLFIGTPDNAGFVKIGGFSEVLRLDEAYNHSNSGFIKTNAAFGHANSAFIHANAAYLSQNASGQYANGAYAHANAAYANANAAYVKSNSAYIHANSAYIETNAAFHHANSGFIKTNTSFAHANAAYSNANGAFAAANAAYIQANSGFIQTNSAFDHANAAYISQNATGQYANAAFTKANGAFIHANSGFIQSNAAFQRANNSLSANVGGVVTGDVTITGNLAVIGNTTYVNTSQVLIADNIITLNAAINQTSAPILNAGIEIDRGIDANVYVLWNETIDKWTVTNDGTNYYVIGSDAAESYANSAFIKANASFDHANAAYISQNATGQYANSAFIEANSAFIHANAAYQSQNSTGNYANSAFIEANSAFIHANAAYQSQNATGQYANAAFIRANNSLNANVGGQVTGDVTFVGNVTSNTLTISGSNGTISGANAIFANYVFASNSTVDLYIYSSNAYANANAGFAKANAAFIWANAAYNQANTNKSNLVNTGYTAQLYSNSTFVLPGNLLFGPSNGIISNPDVGVISIQANDESGNTGLYLADVSEAVLYGKTGVLIQTNVGSLPKDFFFGADGTLRFPDSTKQNTAFIGYGIDNVARSHSNSAYESQNSTGQYANAAFNHANSAYISQNATGQYANSAFIEANSAFIHANAAYQSQNATGNVANSGFIQSNSAFIHANAAYQSQNASGQYANAAFNHANSAYATANVKTETFIQTSAPASANVDDIWIDSLSGIQYVYVNSNSANQWVEFGPYGSPLNGTANVQFADQTIFTVKSGENLVLLSSGADIHLNAAANVVTMNLIPSNPSISLGSSDRPFKNVWVSNASIHLSNNGLRITSETNPENVVIESGGLIIRGGALRANSFLDVTHLYALNVESSLVISNATFSSENALVKIVGSNTGYSQPPANPGYMLHITGKANTASRIVNDSFGVDANTYPAFIGRAARGTTEAPTAVKAGDVISRFAGSAYNGTNYSQFGTGRIDIYASQDHTVSNTGTYIVMSTVANNTNIVSNIAMFDGNTSIIYGSLQVSKGYIEVYRKSNVANSTAVTIDFANDSVVRCTVNSAMTVTLTNYLAGKTVELWVTNLTTISRTVTHGVAATNSTNGATTKAIPSNSVAVFKYMSWDGDLANTQVTIHQG